MVVFGVQSVQNHQGFSFVTARTLCSKLTVISDTSFSLTGVCSELPLAGSSSEPEVAARGAAPLRGAQGVSDRASAG